MDRIADIIAGITTVALITTLVMHKNTANVIRAGGAVYEGALRAAMGR